MHSINSKYFKYSFLHVDKNSEFIYLFHVNIAMIKVI